MRPIDIESLHVPGPLTASGDPRSGGVVLAAVASADVESDEYRSAIHRIRADGGQADMVWTHGGKDSAPAISPDGRWVAFLRVPAAAPAGVTAGGAGPAGNGASGRPQVHVIPVDGGDAVAVTAAPLGAGAPVWAPDSRRIAFVARFPEPGRYGSPDADDRTPASSAEAPRHIARTDYRIDGVGFLRDRFARLVVVDALAAVESGAVPDLEPITNGTDVSDPAWTPDGTGLVVAAARDWGADETLASDLWRVPATGGDPELLVRTAGEAGSPVFGPDGRLWYLGSDLDHGVVASPMGLWVADLAGGAPTRVTDHRTVDVAPIAPVVRETDVLVGVLHRGAVDLRSFPVHATDAVALDAAPALLSGDVVVKSFAAAGSAIVAVVASPTSAGDIVVIDTDAGPDAVRTTTLTDWSADLRPVLRPVVELDGTGADGYPVHGWLVLPEGDGPHPVLHVVHGGPFAQQDRGVFDEAQVYAAAGYAVVLGNPRGSAGYGVEHGRAVVHAMGTVDVADVLALLDVALERDDLDGSRVGIMGGSYGGFMTSWLASHHGERFVAAWSERAVNAWDSFAGSSDIGWFFADAYVGADPDEQRRRSPLTTAGDVTIPFMVAHSEQDWRCPLEQGQRQFVALRRAGVDVEFLLFPGEGHELSRSGNPRHRVQRFDAVLDWWARRLPVSASGGPRSVS